MTAEIDIGTDAAGKPVVIDIEELLATRLLVQGNSGSGKSHLLRRLLEESARMVQQVVIDPEGDFVTLADAFGHVVIDGGALNEREIALMGARVREHRASVVLNLESLEVDAQMTCAATLLNALFDAPRDHWYPALVVVDEAQMFAPSASGDVTDAARRISLSAMTNLMCRGRKRGLAGVIATQRLAKLAKNVAAEASNFLMGRTFLDIDMARAADLLGMERRQAEQIRDLERGSFIGLGPAIARRPVRVRIGPVRTGVRSGTHNLLPIPEAAPEAVRTMLFAELEQAAEDPRPQMAHTPPAQAETADELLRRLAMPGPSLSAPPEPEATAPTTLFDTAAPARPDAAETEEIVRSVLEDMLADPDCAFRTTAQLYQDFSVRCRMRRLLRAPLDLAAFRTRHTLAQGGILDPAEPRWEALLAVAARVPEGMLAPFLLIARAAMDGAPCPDDESLARAYGTASPGRIRRLIDHMEKLGIIVARTDYAGRRTIGIPDLGLSTAAE